jgi:hypothetical protein
MSTDPRVRAAAPSSRRILWLILLPLIVVIGGAGAALGYRSGRGGQPAAAVEKHDTAALEQQLVMMQAQLRSLERRSTLRAAQAQSARPSQSKGGAETASPSSPRQKPATEADQREYFAKLDQGLDAEPRDTDWALATEQKLRQLGQGTDSGIEVGGARCGQTTCRLELKRNLGETGPSGLGAFVQHAAGVLPQVIVEYSDDPSRVILHLHRPGGEFAPLGGALEDDAPSEAATP